MTLSKLTSFKTSFTEEIVRKAELKSDEMDFEGEPIPELKGSNFVEGSAAETAPANSICCSLATQPGCVLNQTFLNTTAVLQSLTDQAACRASADPVSFIIGLLTPGV